MKEITVADWAYAAAMMDGEGSFSISHGTGKSKAGNIIKKRQADVALEFVSLFGQHNPERRQELREMMLELNKVGSPETNTLGVPSGNDGIKIESDLIGDYESAPVVTLTA